MTKVYNKTLPLYFAANMGKKITVSSNCSKIWRFTQNCSLKASIYLQDLFVQHSTCSVLCDLWGCMRESPRNKLKVIEVNQGITYFFILFYKEYHWTPLYQTPALFWEFPTLWFMYKWQQSVSDVLKRGNPYIRLMTSY